MTGTSVPRSTVLLPFHRLSRSLCCHDWSFSVIVNLRNSLPATFELHRSRDLKQFLGDRYKYRSGLPRATGPLSCLSVTLVCCEQMVGWIKMALGTELGLSPGHIVRWGPSSPPRKGAEQHPHFLAHVCCGEMVAHLS